MTCTDLSSSLPSSSQYTHPSDSRSIHTHLPSPKMCSLSAWCQPHRPAICRQFRSARGSQQEPRVQKATAASAAIPLRVSGQAAQLADSLTVTATGSLQTARQPEAVTPWASNAIGSEHDGERNWEPPNGTRRRLPRFPYNPLRNISAGPSKGEPGTSSSATCSRSACCTRVGKTAARASRT